MFANIVTWWKKPGNFLFPVETLLLSRRNKLGQLMCVPEEVGSRLSEMIHFEARLVAAYPRWSASGKQTSPVRSWIFPLPIFIKDDPTCWWRSVLCQFSWRTFGLLVARSVIMWKITALSWWHNLSWWHHLFLCKGLWSCAGGRPFVSSWFRLEVDKTTCMPAEQMILLYETQSRCSINVPFLLNQWKFIFCSFDFRFAFILNLDSGAKLHAGLKIGPFLNQEWAFSEASISAKFGLCLQRS